MKKFKFCYALMLGSIFSLPTITSCDFVSEEQISINISIEESNNGKISLKESQKEFYTHGEKVYLKIEPDEGYELSSLSCNSNDITSKDYFVVSRNTKIYKIVGEFKKITNEEQKASISSSIEGEGTLKFLKDGLELTSLDNLEIDDAITINCVPSQGFTLKSLKVNDKDITESCSFIIEEKIVYNVHAIFTIVDEDKFGIITIENTSHGQITIANTQINPNKVAIGTIIELNVSPEENYYLSSLTVNNRDILNSLSFTVTEDIEYVVKATFVEEIEEEFASIIINSSDYGEITVGGNFDDPEAISIGTVINVEVTPNTGYKLVSLFVNSLDITNTKKFTVEKAISYIINANFVEITGESTIATLEYKSNSSLNPGSSLSLETSSFEQTNIVLSSVQSSNLYAEDDGFRISSSKNSGRIIFTFTSSYSIFEVKLYGHNYNDDVSTVDVTAGSIKVSQTFDNGLSYSFDGSSVDTLEISSSSKNRVIINKIEIFIDGKSQGGSNTGGNDEEKTGYVETSYSGKGSVILSKNEGIAGDLINLVVKPETGYYTYSVKNNGNYCTRLSGTEYCFELVEGKNLVDVVFMPESSSESDYSYLYANNKIKPSRGSSGSIDSYYESVRGLSGKALKDGLHEIIKKDHKTYSYSSLNETMLVTDVDPDNSSNIILTYEGSYPKSTSFNKEHTWAKSIGNFGTSQGPGTDMHHLRPSNNYLNSTRSNYDFETVTNGKDCGTAFSWSRNTMKGNKVTSGAFEPKDDFKGDVARMIFYMATRYDSGDSYDLEVGINGSISGIDTSLYNTFGSGVGIHGNFNDLYLWATTSIDPVSDFEVNRNNVIDISYQHNRNPFIDHPEFVIMIYDKNYKGKGALNE